MLAYIRNYTFVIFLNFKLHFIVVMTIDKKIDEIYRSNSYGLIQMFTGVQFFIYSFHSLIQSKVHYKVSNNQLKTQEKKIEV